jgi:muramoyltetrapeptide carboxypeptidase
MSGWQGLKKGDLVDVIAPGSKCTQLELENGLQFLQAWGLRTRVARNIFGQDPICANTDEIRFSQLRDALTNSESKAVWCVRGGYGSIRLVPSLARLRRPKGSPKLFIGYSDVTTIHVFLNQEWNWPTIHGPMLDRLGRNITSPKHLRELKSLVFGGETEILFNGLKPMNQAAKKVKTIRGQISGGNLVTLQSSIGTEAAWKTNGRIIFLEEIAERGYRLDRMFSQLSQVGAFKNAKAIVLGDFLGGDEKDGTTQVPRVLRRFAESLDIPVMKGIRAGHGSIQRPVPFATVAKLKTGARGSLICSTGLA